MSKSISRPIGNIQSWKRTNTGIECVTEHGNIRITMYTDSIARVCVATQDQSSDFSYAVITQPQEVKFAIDEDDQAINLRTSYLITRVNKHPFSVSFQDLDSAVINEDDPTFSIRWNGEQVTAYKKLQPGERFLGLGEKNGPLDKRGRGYINWNTDNFAYSPDADPLYSSIPFYVGLHSNKVYGIFLDNSFRSQFNFGASNDRFASFTAEAGDLNYYFIHGKTIAEVIRNYTHLTGRTPLPPLWSIGYHQCRYSYYPDKEVINIAENFRTRNFPGDAIVLDIHYMNGYKIFTWDKKHFPDPKGLIEKLKAKGFHVVVMCDPGIKTEAGYEPYESGKKENIFLKYPDGSEYTGQVWPGWCHFPDFTNSKTRQWWADHFKQYVEFGVEGFWNDMNEIATWGNMLPDLIEFDFEGNKTTAREGRNVYGLMMARSTYEGTKKLLKNRRPFNLTRAGFAGIQRYAAVWTGDNVAYDAHMMAGVRLLNSMGLSGLAFTGYDIGGFVGNADEKLFARWISIGAFSPFFRGHSMINSRDSEPWSYGEKVEEISRNYMKLRYRLLPYLYSLFYDASKTGMPVNRSLAFDFTFDDHVYDHKYHNEYLFGPAILVAPVESTKELEKVYLPASKWYELFTDKIHAAGEFIAECPVDRLPLFVRESSIIPMREHAGETTNDHGQVLEIHLYYGEIANRFLFYEDDGISYDYENGTYSIRDLEWIPSSKEFIIRKREGNYQSPFSSIRLFLHGFTDLATPVVNSSEVSLSTRDYRFVEPISNFDPVNTMPEAPTIHSLKFISLPYDEQEIIVRL